MEEAIRIYLKNKCLLKILIAFENPNVTPNMLLPLLPSRPGPDNIFPGSALQTRAWQYSNKGNEWLWSQGMLRLLKSYIMKVVNNKVECKMFRVHNMKVMLTSYVVIHSFTKNLSALASGLWPASVQLLLATWQSEPALSLIRGLAHKSRSCLDQLASITFPCTRLHNLKSGLKGLLLSNHLPARYNRLPFLMHHIRHMNPDLALLWNVKLPKNWQKRRRLK